MQQCRAHSLCNGPSQCRLFLSTLPCRASRYMLVMILRMFHYTKYYFFMSNCKVVDRKKLVKGCREINYGETNKKYIRSQNKTQQIEMFKIKN
jgi:hypothetical protein